MKLKAKGLLSVAFAGTIVSGCLGLNSDDTGSVVASRYAKTNAAEEKIETSCWDLPNGKKTEKCLRAQAEAKAEAESDATALNAPYYLSKVAQVSHNVGVTSDVYYPGGTGCPAGSTSIAFNMDDENSANATSQSVYTGGWFETPVHNTDAYWCKLNEDESMKFASLRSPSTVGFMVLKLGQECPNNGYTIKRYFDNEDTAPIQNSKTGDITPNLVDDNTHMYFCYYPPQVFDASLPTRVAMPTITNFAQYGVASKNAGAYFGWYYTDDEDSNNANYLTIPAAVTGQARTQVTQIIEASNNTKIHFGRVPN